MLHVVTSANRSSYGAHVEESFRIRHRIYVGERGWKDLDRPDKREVDQFDNEDAIYLLAIDDREQRVVGGSRLVPTIKPHLLSDVFPQLATARPIPRAPDIYEWTRFYIVPERREPHAMSEVACIIMCGVQEYCLNQGVRQLSIVTEPFWIPRFLRLGWEPKPLGLPIEWQGMEVVAIAVSVSEAALSTTREMRGIRQTVLATPIETRLAG